MTSLQNISIIKVSLCLLAFSTGLGIEFPWVNLAGNLSVFDVFLCIFVFILTRSLKLTHLSAFPVMIGIIGLCSIGYNSLFTYSYHQVGFVAIPIAFRWMYFGFLLSLYYTYSKTLKDMYLYLFSILSGVITLLVYAWYNWTFKQPEFQGFPVLAFIENLNANTLGFYFCSSISILIFLYKKGYMSVVYFWILFTAILLSTIATISKAAIITAALVILFYTKISVVSVVFGGILASVAIYSIWDVAAVRWSASQVSNQERTTLISNAYEMFLMSPVFGVGPKGFASTDLTSVTDSHNAFFNVLAEYGLLGFSTYLMFVVYLLILRIPKIMKICRQEGYFLLIYFGSIQTIGLTTGLTYSDKISWIIIGCVLGAVRSSVVSVDVYPSKSV